MSLIESDCMTVQEVSTTVSRVEANWSPTHHKSLFHVVTELLNEVRDLTSMDVDV